MKSHFLLIALGMVLALPRSFAVQNGESQALPPLEAVLKRVKEQAQKEDDERAFKSRYSYIRNRLTEYRNAKGELKKREEKVRTNNPTSAPITLTPPPSGKMSPVDPNAGLNIDGRGKAFERSEFAVDDNLLNRFEFALFGRETIRGRPALIVDFKPAAKQPPERNLKEKFINKAAGRAWVDEQENTVVKANLYLTEPVNVFGGLVGAVRKFEYDFDRGRTEEGFWYTRTVNWHLEAREVFFRRMIDYHEGKTNVTKVW